MWWCFLIPRSRHNRAGLTALMWDINGRLAIVKLLSDKGACINAQSNDGKDALLFAALYGRLDVCLFLVSRSGLSLIHI